MRQLTNFMSFFISISINLPFGLGWLSMAVSESEPLLFPFDTLGSKCFRGDLANNEQHFLGLACHDWETQITFFLANGRKGICHKDGD